MLAKDKDIACRKTTFAKKPREKGIPKRASTDSIVEKLAISFLLPKTNPEKFKIESWIIKQTANLYTQKNSNKSKIPSPRLKISNSPPKNKEEKKIISLNLLTLKIATTLNTILKIKTKSLTGQLSNFNIKNGINFINVIKTKKEKNSKDLIKFKAHAWKGTIPILSKREAV